MKTLVSFIFFFIFFYNFANANIVEELTSLNNLYKEEAITMEEFIKAKSILLQTKDKEEDKKKKKQLNKKKLKKKKRLRIKL